MIWLPELPEIGNLRLPLSPEAGPALVALFAGASAAESAARGAVHADPALALWTLLRAWQAGQANLRTVDSLADWLATHVGDALVWPTAPDATPDDQQWRSGYHQLSASSLAVARGARDLAIDTNASQAAEIYLLGLLHAAPRWFALDPAYERDFAQHKNDLPGPAWLTAAIGQLQEHRPQGDECARYVAQALSMLEGEVPPDVSLVSPPAGSAALTALSHSLPALTSKLSRAAQLERAFEARLTNAKLGAMAEFAAGAGHEINNPIAVIAGRAQLLIEGEPLADRRRELAVINSQAMRVYEMIADMMLFARPPAPHKAVCDLYHLADGVVGELVAAARQKKVTVVLEPVGTTISATVDISQLAVALKAVCQNAIDAVAQGGRVNLSLEQAADGRAVFRVADNGPGLTREVLDHLFDPFYCGRAAGRRLGMGLAKAWRIVRNHGGQITAENRPDGGALLTLTLPG